MRLLLAAASSAMLARRYWQQLAASSRSMQPSAPSLEAASSREQLAAGSAVTLPVHPELIVCGYL
jgi:hypothetical protein